MTKGAGDSTFRNNIFQQVQYNWSSSFSLPSSLLSLCSVHQYYVISSIVPANRKKARGGRRRGVTESLRQSLETDWWGGGEGEREKTGEKMDFPKIRGKGILLVRSNPGKKPKFQLTELDCTALKSRTVGQTGSASIAFLLPFSLFSPHSLPPRLLVRWLVIDVL